MVQSSRRIPRWNETNVWQYGHGHLLFPSIVDEPRPLENAKYVSLERWCRLRGNLLFYFKSREQWSEPLGVIILEQCFVRMEQPSNQIPYGFSIVFDGGLFQALGANSAEERDSWLQALQLASYECMRSQLLALQQRIEAFSGHKHDTDIQMLRLQRGISADPAEIPICEISLACDNLLCDGHGRPPNPVLEVDVQVRCSKTWIKYARTEVVEVSFQTT
ncbi:sesquipedalian-2-like isoform X2 [Frieseomelitta varia]|uniref:sesquipedalian-2-like isoform X2 n=1 Tax=Frieseomelitta varia TaxID=561572 RepID=UPI001CB691B9|nr:sesquipedalian-2-like isoform X2 [Frieseomelitta varia]